MPGDRPPPASPPRRPAEVVRAPRSDAGQPFELGVAVGGEREQRERQRLEERRLLLVADEEDLAGPRDARRREGGEAPAGSADARVPRGADGRKRALERRLHAAVEPLDPARLEDDGAVLDRVDREARVLEAPEGFLPLALDRGRVPLDERERRARRKRLSQAHPRLDPGRRRGSGHGPEQRLLPRPRSERRRLEREPRLQPKRRLELEPGNEETGNHPNTCSIRTRVLLSSSNRPPLGREAFDERGGVLRAREGSELVPQRSPDSRLNSVPSVKYSVGGFGGSVATTAGAAAPGRNACSVAGSGNAGSRRLGGTGDRTR